MGSPLDGVKFSRWIHHHVLLTFPRCSQIPSCLPALLFLNILCCLLIWGLTCLQWHLPMVWVWCTVKFEWLTSVSLPPLPTMTYLGGLDPMTNNDLPQWYCLHDQQWRRGLDPLTNNDLLQCPVPHDQQWLTSVASTPWSTMTSLSGLDPMTNNDLLQRPVPHDQQWLTSVASTPWSTMTYLSGLDPMTNNDFPQWPQPYD